MRSSSNEITASLIVSESPPVVPSLEIAMECLVAKACNWEASLASIATITRHGVSLKRSIAGLDKEIVAPTLWRKTISVNPADSPP